MIQHTTRILVLFFAILGTSLLSNAQSTLNIGDSYLVMDGGSETDPLFLVVDNASTTAINHAGTGHIISASEHDRIKWNIGTSTANYTFPFGIDSTYIPFTYDVTTAGVGSGSLEVSTWASPANAILPAGGYTVCPDENSAMDRFWTISASDYTTNPTATIRFYYNEAELDAIDETQLVAQRGNLALGCPWEYPVGAVNSAANYVEVDTVNGSSPWVLSFEADPLPIVLLYFHAEWKNDNYDVAVIDWLTTTEINNAYFVVERSVDGQNFYPIDTVMGAGTSLESNYYAIEDRDPYRYQTSYYRLYQVDYNGEGAYSGVAVLTPEMEVGGITVYPNPFNENLFYSLYNETETQVDILLYNELGERMLQYRERLPAGDIRQPILVNQLYPGAYLLLIRTVNDNPKLTKELYTTVVKIR